MPSHDQQFLPSVASTFVLTLVSTTLFLAEPLSGQILASERAQVSQTVDGTTLTLDYSRPSARGRELFGALVPWDAVWTPGANWATTFTSDGDVQINGVDVSAGTYSVWAIPRPDHFTVTLNPEPELMHFVKPDSSDAQIHLAVEPRSGAHTELLTWSFPNVRGDATVLQFQWGTTVVPMEVWVEPSRPLALEDWETEQYVGAYEMQMTPGIGWPETGLMEVFPENGMLRARMPFGIHPEDDLVFDLVPAGEGRFNPGLYRGGEFFGVELSVNIDFHVGGGRSQTVVWRGPMGTQWAQGRRATQDR